MLVAACLLGPPVPGEATGTGTEATLSDRIGRMLIIGFRGLNAGPDSRIVERIRRQRIGGVVLFRRDVPTGSPNRNIRSPAQVRALTRSLQDASGYPLLIAVDQEGGEIARLAPEDGFPPVPSAASLGRLPVARTREAAGITARLLADLGINWNLAPVVDLATNPESPAIAGLERSFGRRPERVTARASAVIRAHRKAGVLTALKHFPGHGSARVDSHQALPDVTATWSPRELLPYRRLLEGRLVDAVMVGHLRHRKLDPEWPASLSRGIVGGLLREELGFRGVVVTDDLQMGAIRRQSSLETTILRAIRAGADLLMFANNTVYEPEIAARAKGIIRELVREGRIRRSRIDRSYRRIQELTAGIRSGGLEP